MSISFSARIAVKLDVMFRTVGDESVLLQLNRETYLGLDAVGTRMWTLLTTSESIQRAYELLLAEYDVDPEQLRRDLQQFVAKLVEHGLVQLGASETDRVGAR